MNKKRRKQRKQLRQEWPRCCSCHSPALEHFAWDGTGRPFFRCLSCLRTWTCGRDGGDYYLAAASHPQRPVVLGFDAADYAQRRPRIAGPRLEFAG